MHKIVRYIAGYRITGWLCFLVLQHCCFTAFWLVLFLLRSLSSFLPLWFCVYCVFFPWLFLTILLYCCLAIIGLWCVFLWFSSCLFCWGFLSFLVLWGYSFLQIFENFSNYFFQKFFVSLLAPFLLGFQSCICYTA